MNKSNTISKLSLALSKAQAEMPIVKMNAQNPFLKNKYADLGAVIETSRPVLAKNGLSISQFPTSVGDQIGLTSILMHESGEFLEETISIPASDSKGLSVAQSAGVVISYLRRYSWASMLGLYADEDTDGHQNGNSKEVENKSGKKELTDSEKKKYMLDTYSKLFERAKKVKLTIPSMKPDMPIESMKAQYAEQKKFVEQAEEQAKAGA